MMCGSEGLDAEELRDKLPQRWDHMFSWDTEAAVKHAIDLSVELRTPNGHS